MRELIVRRIDKCIDCQACINACKRRHGKARMKMEGVTFDCVSLPNVCKFCKDPKCVKACRKEAMVKERDNVHVDAEKCIGCGLCKKACPYDAIEIIDRKELERKSFLKKKKEETKKKKRAYKCDLCIGFKCSACVEACPTRSLNRVEVDKYQDEGSEEILDYVNNPAEKSKKKENTT